MNILSKQGFMVSFLILLASQLLAGGVSIPNTFTANTTAVANEVNENFTAVKNAIDANDVKITSNASSIVENNNSILQNAVNVDSNDVDIITNSGDINTNYNSITVNTNNIDDNSAAIIANTNAINNLETTRTVSIPARALAYTPGSAVVSTDSGGLLWTQSYFSGASLSIKTPADYAGGNVKFYIFFKTTTSTSGVVNFFIRPVSYNSTNGLYDPGSIDSTGVAVSGTSGFGIVYEQVFTIPSSLMAKNWWYTTMQRKGTDSTYTDDVVVLGVAFEYTAIQ